MNARVVEIGDKKMHIGSLFSGAFDGLAIGLSTTLGWPIRFTAERRAWRRGVLRELYPDVPRHFTDVAIASRDAEPVTLLCGGFPCQPHSVAGKRKGERDDRFGWPLFARCIDRCNPAIVVVENVPGLRTSGLHRVLCDLADRGFDAEWTYLSARDVGAPHRRTRLWLVAWRVAYADRCELREQPERLGGTDREGTAIAVHDGRSPRMADTYGTRQLQPSGPLANVGRWARNCRDEDWGGWAAEPEVGRVAHGFSDRERWLAALGDAVVPQCAQVIGRSIKDWLGGAL